MKTVHQTRRQFVETSTAALVALLAGDSVGQEHHSASGQIHHNTTSSRHFTFGQIYTGEETIRLLRSGPALSLAGPTPIGLPFWWDPSEKKLVNPTNLSFDPTITAADYQLTATLLNFRASLKELGDVWQKLSNNAQLNLNPGSVSAEGDDIQWIIMTGINVAQGLFGNTGKDPAQLNQNNKPTNSFRPAEATIFKKGVCSLSLTLSAQKKKSVWDKLLAAVKAFTGSSVFGMLPIPKLYQTAVQSVTASLEQLKSQSNLIPVLTGNSYNYKLYSGANPSADLVFRPGHWVVINSAYAAAHMDANKNLSDTVLDIPGLLYQLKDKNNQVVDTTYTVAQLDLTPVPAH